MPRQFELVENLSPTRRREYPFLVVFQHDRVTSINTVVVAPLVESGPRFARTRLHPALTVSGKQYLVLVEEIAAVPRRALGRVVGSAQDSRYDLVAALDLLFTGI